MTAPPPNKLTDRIAQLEQKVDKLTTLLTQNVSTTPVVQPSLSETISDVVVDDSIANNNDPSTTTTTPASAPTPSSSLITPPLSLFTLLSSSSPKTTYTDKEQKLLSSYTKHVDTFLDIHVLDSDNAIVTDYRLIPLTLEFIVAAAPDICILAGKTSLTIEIATLACIWLLDYYKTSSSSSSKTQFTFEVPHNCNLLIKTFFDVIAKKYSLEPLLSEENIQPKKRRYFSKLGFGNHRMRFSTIKQRWTRRTDNGCLPNPMSN